MMRKRKYIDLLFVTLFMNYYILLIRAPLFVESRPVLDSINLNISFNFVTLLRGVSNIDTGSSHVLKVSLSPGRSRLDLA